MSEEEQGQYTGDTIKDMFGNKSYKRVVVERSISRSRSPSRSPVRSRSTSRSPVRIQERKRSRSPVASMVRRFEHDRRRTDDKYRKKPRFQKDNKRFTPTIPYRNGLHSFTCPKGCGFHLEFLGTETSMSSGHNNLSMICKCVNSTGCRKTFLMKMYQEGVAIQLKYIILDE